ncbi:hypothetical protein WAF17_05415 [Bernardetia sp. ABR2-2B]|uniref:hypothetical protein n=1 Tax=Bernardetia sp. ABR2-2B TaxID=3127472 RepID=UPI0030CD8320
MHIHRIDSTSQKHHNFLAQNRKDPITGDSISEGDEVVFCADCKSVFLSDTWEYLGNRHCEQSETLIDFPIEKAIFLKLEDEILFYTSLPKKGKSQKNIPRQVKKEPWLKKSQNISPYQNFLHNPFMRFGKIIAFIPFYILVVIKSNSSFFPLISIPFILEGIIWLHDWYYGNKVESTYQHFKNNTFYITKKEIGFASKYGLRESVLLAKDIEEIIFHERDNLSSNSYCQVYYEEQGRPKKLKFKIHSNLFNNPSTLISALNTLSISHNVPVRIESGEENTLYYVKKMIAEGNSNFLISGR